MITPTTRRHFSQIVRKKLTREDIPGKTTGDVMRGLGYAILGVSVVRLSVRAGITNVLPLLATGGALMGSSTLYSRYRRWRFEEEYGRLEDRGGMFQPSPSVAVVATGLVAVSLPAMVAYDDYSAKRTSELVEEALGAINERASAQGAPLVHLVPERPSIRRTDWNRVEIDILASFEEFGMAKLAYYTITATKETSSFSPFLGKWRLEDVRGRQPSSSS